MFVQLATPGRQRRRSRARNPDDDLSICSHNFDDLNPFIDTRYLDPEYVKRKIEDEGAYLPTICSICKFKIIPFKNIIFYDLFSFHYSFLYLIFVHNTKTTNYSL